MGFFGSFLFSGGTWKTVDAEIFIVEEHPWLRISIYDSDVAMVEYRPKGVGTGEAFLGQTPREYIATDRPPVDGARESAGLAEWALASGCAQDVEAIRLAIAPLLASDTFADGLQDSAFRDLPNEGLDPDVIEDGFDGSLVEDTVVKLLEVLQVEPPPELVDPSATAPRVVPETTHLPRPERADAVRPTGDVGGVPRRIPVQVHHRDPRTVLFPLQGCLFLGSIAVEQAQDLAYEWISAFFTAVYPEAVDLADHRPDMVIDRPATDTTGDVWGQPNGVWFCIGSGSSRDSRYCTAAVRRQARRLRPGGLMGASLYRLDQQGRQDGEVNAYVSASLTRSWEDPAVWGLELRFRMNEVSRMLAAIEATKQFAAVVPDTFAELGFVHTPNGAVTSLLGRLRDGALATSATAAWWPRPYLAGYNWITVVPRRLAEQVTPMQRAAAADELFQLEQLASGALWVWADPDPNAFYATPARALFTLFRGILPPGRPEALSVFMDAQNDALVLQDPRA